jgi:putative MATE family efflux protein
MDDVTNFAPSTQPLPAGVNLTRAASMRSGPILPILLKLALPTVVVLVVQTLVGVAEAYYVGFLGTDSLAGVALVFPVLMLMTMMSNGGIGGGVASAVARCVGAGRSADADALVLHAVVIGVVCGVLFMTCTMMFGSTLYGALGGSGESLNAAVLYSNYVFAGAVPVWIVNLVQAALRGAGNVKVPAVVTLVGAVIVVPLSPILIFGFGPIPALGIAGAGLAVDIYYVGAAVALLRYVASGRTDLTLRIDALQARLFRDILRVGAVAALGTVQANLTVVLVTGAAGMFGAEALAGYGIASRLDYLLIPLMFGLGTAAVTMVGVNVGAGNERRAKRIAWTGALVCAVVTEVIGLAVTLFPDLWLALFSADRHVLAAGRSYLQVVGPFYGVGGLGFLLYFASQGAGRVILPLLAGTARLAIAAGVGWLAVAHLGSGLSGLFAMVAAGSVVFGVGIAVATMLSRWDNGRN